MQLNPYSWSKYLFPELVNLPCQVSDLKTVADAHTFLLKWFELYPEFQSNLFYISGESYAGIYIPTLTDEVVKGIEKGLKPRINLKGYLIGNGATDKDYDFNSFVPFAHGMGLISTDLFEVVLQLFMLILPIALKEIYVSVSIIYMMAKYCSHSYQCCKQFHLLRYRPDLQS